MYNIKISFRGFLFIVHFTIRELFGLIKLMVTLRKRKKMKRLNIGLMGILLIFTMVGCDSEKKGVDLRTGDIIFCNYQSGDLSDAIDEVTQTEKQTHYSHMGLIEIVGKDTFVIHASLKRGVVKETLETFMNIDQPALVDVYRLNDSLQVSVPEAMQRVQDLIGLPYNSHYLMNDSCYYCSQLIYKAFERGSIFQLEPMTFKNPNTNNFNDGWIKHYKALGIEIPEGEPGCNPNGLALSESLRLVGRLP